MKDREEGALPVKARAYLVEPGRMAVIWMNEAAEADLPAAVAADGHLPEGGLPVEKAISLAPVLGLPEALREVAATGSPRQLRADLVPMSRGSFLMAASVYSLPDGTLLVLMEETWKTAGTKTGAFRAGGQARRKR